MIRSLPKPIRRNYVPAPNFAGRFLATAQPLQEPLTVTPDWSAPLLGELRRLAHGHWLLAWWPASALDVIPALDAPLLLAEIALAAVDLDDVLYESADAADGPDSPVSTLSCFDPASEFIECADQTGCGLGDDGDSTALVRAIVAMAEETLAEWASTRGM